MQLINKQPIGTLPNKGCVFAEYSTPPHGHERHTNEWDVDEIRYNIRNDFRSFHAWSYHAVPDGYDFTNGEVV
jgi:hypothetical protein